MKVLGSINGFTYAGTTVRMYRGDPGEGLPRHDHAYDHATMCAHGAITVRKEGKEFTIRQGDSPVNLRAGEWHEIECAEPGSVFVNIFRENRM